MTDRWTPQSWRDKPAKHVPSDYPDTVTLHGAILFLTYRFDPSADDDGGYFEQRVEAIRKVRGLALQ